MVKFIQKKTGCAEALDLPCPESPELPNILVAAAALVDTDGRVLLAQRPEGKNMAGLWEFPGGKVNKNETPAFALMRELEEELGIITRPCCFSPIGFASHSYDTFHLLMPLFVCRVWRGTVTPQEGQEIKWVYPADIYNYSMPDADLPLVGALQELL